MTDEPYRNIEISDRTDQHDPNPNGMPEELSAQTNHGNANPRLDQNFVDDGISAQTNCANAHTREGIIVQPGGGWLKPGVTGQPRTGWKSTRREALRNLRSLTPESVERVRELVRSSDERVSMVAVKEVLDRTLGKPSDMPQGDDEAGGAADLTNLTPVDRIELSAALATVKRLTGRGPGALPLTQPMNGKIVDV